MQPDKVDYRSLCKEEKIFEDPFFAESFLQWDRKARTSFLETIIELAERDLVAGGFRSYDIRIDASRLPSHVVFYLGLKAVPLLKKWTQSLDDSSFLIGIGRALSSARPSSPRIQQSYIHGLRLAGASVIQFGETTTPDVYFGAAYFKNSGIKGVVNISASHNPSQDNGIKHCLVYPDGFITSISSKNMNEFKRHVVKGNPEKESSDKSLMEHLLCLEALPPVSLPFQKERQLSNLHHLFILASAILGKEVMTELNRKHQGNFKALLDSLMPDTQDIESLLALCDKNWKDLLGSLGLPLNLEKPVSFERNFLKDFVVVLDYGTGSTGKTAEIYRALGATLIELGLERGFNPLESKNQHHLKKALAEASVQFPDKEVLGFAHDEDGDRLAVMRRDGISIDGDRLLVLVSSLLPKVDAEGRKVTVITEVKSRPENRVSLAEMGVEALIVPTGFAFIKGAAIELEKAITRYRNSPIEENRFWTFYGKKLDLSKISPVQVWAELSGHFGFSQASNYLFDDASLMAAELLSSLCSLSRNNEKPGQLLIHLDERFKRNISSGELNIFLKTSDPHYIPSSEEKEGIIEEFYSFFKSHPLATFIDRTDGIQIHFSLPENEAGWILARKSNNEDKFIVVTSAGSQKALDLIEGVFFSQAMKISRAPITGLVMKKEDEQGHERLLDSYVKKRVKNLGLI